MSSFGLSFTSDVILFGLPFGLGIYFMVFYSILFNNTMFKYSLRSNPFLCAIAINISCIIEPIVFFDIIAIKGTLQYTIIDLIIQKSPPKWRVFFYTNGCNKESAL